MVRGQAGTVFNLLIYAVIAGAVLALLLGIINMVQPPAQDTLKATKSIIDEAYNAPGSQICKKNTKLKATGQICKSTIKYWTSIEHVEFKVNHRDLKIDGDCVTTRGDKDVQKIQVCAKYDPNSDKIVITYSKNR
jgi:hypothetical protein